MNRQILSVVCTGILALSACGRKTPDVVQAAGEEANAPSNPAPSFTIPPGTGVRVRLQQALDTRRNFAGDHFTATLAEPLVSGDLVVLPVGTVFTGHVTGSKNSGRLKGRAMLAVRLDSFALNGRTYTVDSTRSAVASRNHKRHDLAWIGGSAGSGALIGAAAGGGFGAAVGAGAGAAAGTVGAVVTGKKHVHLAAETSLRFELREPVPIV